jgi:putative sterol carrier protein
MTVADPAFPSSASFDQIAASFKADPKAKEDALKRAKAVFVFVLKKDGKEKTWWLDLKNSGEVGEGKKEGSDVTLTLDDDSFGKLFAGTANAQQLFMTGKLKVCVLLPFEV